VLENLFLTRNTAHINQEEPKTKDVEVLDSKVVPFHSQNQYKYLKKHLKKGKVKESDIDNVLGELSTFRQPVKTLRKDRKFTCIFLMAPLLRLCKKCSSKRVQFELDRGSEIHRKFIKICDMQHIIKSI